MTTPPRLPRDEIIAALAAHRELGPEYDEAFIEAIADRIEESLATRMAAERWPAPAPGRTAESPRKHGWGADLALAVVSVVVAVPLGASAVVNSGDTALFFVLIAIVLINLAYARRSRRR